jgi:hypothetical protein
MLLSGGDPSVSDQHGVGIYLADGLATLISALPRQPTITLTQWMRFWARITGAEVLTSKGAVALCVAVAAAWIRFCGLPDQMARVSSVKAAITRSVMGSSMPSS